MKPVIGEVTKRELLRGAFHISEIDEIAYVGKTYAEQNGIFTFINGQGRHLEGQLGGCFLVRSTRASNRISQASGEQGVICLDKRWYEYIQSLIRIERLLSSGLLGGDSQKIELAKLLARGLSAVIALEHMLNVDPSASHIQTLAAENATAIAEFRTYSSMQDASWNLDNSSVQIVRLMAPLGAMHHEIGHVLKFVDQRSHLNYKAQVLGSIGTLRRPKFEINHTIQVNDFHCLSTNTSQAASYCVKNDHSLEELIADCEMHDYLLDFKAFTGQQWKKMGFESRTVFLGWFCNLCSFLAEAVCRISELKFATSITVRPDRFAAEKVLSFYAEYVARRRLALPIMRNMMFKKNRWLFLSPLERKKFDDFTTTFSRGLHGAFDLLMREDRSRLLRIERGSATGVRTFIPVDSVLEFTGYFDDVWQR